MKAYPQAIASNELTNGSDFKNFVALKLLAKYLSYHIDFGTKI